MPKVLKPPDEQRSRKAIEVFFDFQWKSFAQAFDGLAKALAFYFLILAASVGLIYQSKLEGADLIAVVALLVVVTALTSAAFHLGSRGLLGAMRHMASTLRRLDPRTFEELNLPYYFARARTLTRAISLLCQTILLAIVLFTASIPIRGKFQLTSKASASATSSPGAATSPSTMRASPPASVSTAPSSAPASSP